MNDDKNTRVLSAQEVNAIMALPDRKFIIAGIERYGKFNEETGLFYLLNDDGTLNGRIAKTIRKDRPPDGITLDEENNKLPANTGQMFKHSKFSLIKKFHRLTVDSKHDDSSTNSTDDSGTSGIKEPKRRSHLGLVISGLAITFLLLMVTLPKITSQVQPNDELSTPSLETIDVIQVTQDLIPGDFISENNIQRTSISAETYNQIYLGSSQLYQWSRYEALTGNQVITYIPRGQYLTYDNVASVYLQPTNPWLSEVEGMTYVIIPLTEEVLVHDNFSYGSVVDLTITKQTVKEFDHPEDSEQDNAIVNIPGLDHQMSVQQSYVVDTYGMSDITICDLLNGRQESLYSTYTSWIAIPTGERLTYLRNLLKDNEPLKNSLVPSYAKIRISNEQAAELGDLTSSNISISFIAQETINNETEAKAAYAAEVRALQDTISEAIMLNEKAEDTING